MNLFEHGLVPIFWPVDSLKQHTKQAFLDYRLSQLLQIKIPRSRSKVWKTNSNPNVLHDLESKTLHAKGSYKNADATGLSTLN